MSVTPAETSTVEALSSGSLETHVIVDADRLMPLVTYESVTVTDPNNSSDSATVNAVSTALFTNGAMNTFYTLPRLGLDTVVGPGFTLRERSDSRAPDADARAQLERVPSRGAS